MPGVCAFTALLEKRWLRPYIAVCVLGFLINSATLISFYERFYCEQFEAGTSESQLLWSPAHAPFLHAWPAAIRQISDATRQDASLLLMERGAEPAHKIADSRALRIVAVWWWMLGVAHIPRWIGACLSLLLVSLAIWILLPSRKRTRVVALEPAIQLH